MKAKDFQAKDVEGLKSWFEANVGDDFRPTLAIVFSSLPDEIREAGKMFGVPMVGLLSSGEMARGTGGRLEYNALTSCCVLLKEVNT